MSLNSNLNPDVVKTYLDDVWDQKFNGQEFPGHATAQTAAIFPVVNITNSRYIQDEFAGTGDWESTPEETELPEGTPRVYNTKTTIVANFKKELWIPVEFMEDQEHGSYEKAVANFARRAITTRDNNAFALFRNAFSTTLTADGLAWGHDSHTTNGAGTVDNLTTSALTDTSLKAAYATLYQQKALDGVVDGHVASILIVSPAKFADAVTITQSKRGIAGSANNDMNYFSELFPNMMVFTSPYLGDAAGGDDDDWFLLSADHSIQRILRKAPETKLVDYIYDSKDRYCYKGRFRESVHVMSYEGSYLANVA